MRGPNVITVPKGLTGWDSRVRWYLSARGAMPMHWTTANVADRRCARCGFVLREHGLVDPRGVPACSACAADIKAVVEAL